MAPILTDEQLNPVYEKLKRANENILNLNSEINSFIGEQPARGLVKDSSERLDEWAKYHAKRGIPPRFGILAGEILYQLRSSLDHLAWILSSEGYRKSDERKIAFPICLTRPTTEKELAIYQRQICGITSNDALDIIEKVQPYHADNPSDVPLAILHKLNRIDKHQTIVLVVGTFDMRIGIPNGLFNQVVIGTEKISEEQFSAVFQKQVQVEMARQIAFDRFGQRKNQTVVPSLMHLGEFVRDVVVLFGS